MSSLKNNLLTISWLLLRFILGVAFIISSIDKIINPAKFLEIINNYNLIPTFITPAVVIILPWTEFICGLFLLLGILTNSAAVLIIFLLLGFIFGVSINIYRGADIECGCFGLLFEGESIGLHTIIRDLIMMFFAVALIFLNKNIWKIERLISKKIISKN
jgi:uncharacterized membrane protein YphA (DoxX/SURF4 family)